LLTCQLQLFFQYHQARIGLAPEDFPSNRQTKDAASHDHHIATPGLRLSIRSRFATIHLFVDLVPAQSIDV
jgi:hypothetical protein